jgi:16S rRNA (cytosine1402-N4)-methyltransferase
VCLPYHHEPVLLRETLEALRPRPEGLYVDCTVGGGGHSAAIVRQLAAGGRLIALDRDPAAVRAATDSLDAALTDRPQPLRPRVDVVHAPFSRLGPELHGLGVSPGQVDGLLADLGVSSPQLDQAERGFSFNHDAPLDMRMNPTAGTSAAELLATIGEGELIRLLREGDERKARRIARAVIRRRDDEPIETTAQLAELVSRAVGGRRGSRIHPATRTFQALRIRVNDEDGELRSLLDQAVGWLRPGGRLAVITFHSGEDRPVKRRFVELARDCVCPSSDPICTCDAMAQVFLPSARGVTASPEEIDLNPRARSARLRVAERLEPEDDR